MTSVQEVPMKIALVRSGEVVEVRRRRLVNPSYEVVEKVASEVARGKYRLQYTDEDGDVVTMSSQEEWEECLASWDAAHPLKLRIELRGPRGLGRRGCRSESRSRSRSVSPHRRCHTHSRSRSVSSDCKRWGRRSLSPACWRKSSSSRHMPRGFPCGRTHSPQRFQAWLAKMEAAAKAYRCTPVECDESVEQPKAGETAQAVHPFLLRGFPFAACASKGMHGHGKGFKGMRGHCGKRKHEHDSTAADDAEKANESSKPSSDEQAEAAQPEEPFRLFRDLLGAFAGKGMHGHGKGFKGAHGHGGKGGKGMPEHAGHRHMHMHDSTAADDAEKANESSKPSRDEQAEAAQPEDPLRLFSNLLGAFAGKGMHGHGKGFKGAHGHGGKGGKGMPEHAGHRRMHGLRTVNSELIGQKCANCEFQTTGVVDLYCCRSCMFGKDHHGKRCQQLPFGEEKNTAEMAEETPEAPVEDDAPIETKPAEQVHKEEANEQSSAASTAEEESPAAPAPFAREIAHLEEMGVAVTPQMVDNLTNVAAVFAGLFAKRSPQ